MREKHAVRISTALEAAVVVIMARDASAVWRDDAACDDADEEDVCHIAREWDGREVVGGACATQASSSELESQFFIKNVIE